MSEESLMQHKLYCWLFKRSIKKCSLVSFPLPHKKKMFTSHRLHVITYISFRQSQKEKKIELSPEFVVSQSMKIICVNN